MLCYKCGLRPPYKEYNSLCLPCIADVAVDIANQIKLFGPIVGVEENE